MSHNKKTIWIWAGFLLLTYFAYSITLLDEPIAKSLVKIGILSFLVFSATWIWRRFRLYRIFMRIFTWIYWRTPFSRIPKSIAVILVAFSLVLIFFGITLGVLYKLDQPPSEPYVSKTDFKDMVFDKKIEKYVILKRYSKILGPREIVFFLDSIDGQKKWTYFDDAPPAIPQSSPGYWLDQQGLNVTEVDSFPWSFTLMNLMAGLMMSIPFFFFMWLVGGGGLRSTMQEWSTIRKATMQRHPPVYFNEIGGLENAIKEARDLVAFLQDPRTGRELGARMPTGVLLSGPTGSGKTMFAKAIATEAGVPLFHISGSDFRKPLVGLGSETVKFIFDLGRRNAPCVIFIDELDSAVPVRGTGNLLSGNEGDAVTNTVLSEVDDINKRGLAILVIGATNLFAKVDEAAKRPGRFDRPFVIQYPDEKGRAKIITKQLSTVPTPFGTPVVNNADPKKPFETFSPVSAGFVEELANELAKVTPGFSGAALNALNNEARVIAWRKNRDGLRKGTFITRGDFYEALPRALTRSQKADRVLDERALELIAWHEGGHTYFSYLCKGAEPAKFMFLEPHAEVGGMAILGGDNDLPTKPQMFAKVWVLLGGYITEKAHFGTVTTGSSADIRNLTKILRAMTHSWGMGEQGPIDIDVLEGQTDENTYARIRGPISHEAQKEARALAKKAKKDMLALLEDKTPVSSHYAKIGALAAAVREKHMMREAEIKEIIGDIEQIEVTA